MRLYSEKCTVTCNMLVPLDGCFKEVKPENIQDLCLAVALVKAAAPVSATLVQLPPDASNSMYAGYYIVPIKAYCSVSDVPVEHLIAANALTIVADMDSPVLENVDGFDRYPDVELDKLVSRIQVRNIAFQIPSE